MSTEGSPYGKGFVIRMLVLLGILAGAVGGFYYDRQVLIPGAEKKIDEVQNLIVAKTDDGGGIPQSQVDETIGNLAVRKTREHTQKVPEDLSEERLKTFKPKTYEVVTYEFKRIIPFMLEPYSMEVAYHDKAVVYSSPGKPIPEEMLDSGFESKYQTVEIKPGMMPSVGGAGGAVGGGGGGDDDEEEDDDESAADKDKDEDAGSSDPEGSTSKDDN